MSLSSESALDRTTVTVRQGPLVGPVLSRAVAIHAARAPLPVDRLNDALLVADAVAARAPAFCVGDRLPVSLRAADGELELRIGPLREGGAERVLEGATVPGGPNVVSKLADEVRVRTGSGGAEYLVVRFAA